MKWTYGVMLLADDYFGELIIGIRTAEDGTRQTTPGNQPTYDRIWTEDGVTLVIKPNRDEIIKAWEEAAAHWQKNQPHRHVEWYDMEPVYGSPAWESWMASSR